MKIKCIDFVTSIVDINNININVADMLWSAFSYVDIFSKDVIDNLVTEGKSEYESIIEILFDFYQLDRDNADNIRIMNDYFLKNLKKLDPEEYLNNPYVKVISSQGKKGPYVLKYLTYSPYQLFAYDDIKVDDKYQEHSAIGYFDTEFSYLALVNNQNVWMSLNPNEIQTMKPYIEKGKGQVLVLGLGMGYVPFMLALKKEVKSITIIEKDPAIIALFEEIIIPNFPNKEKIIVIKDDALAFLRKNQKGEQYDYLFADLWHNADDGLELFVALKRINRNIDCWLETSLIALLRRNMITLLEEQLEGKDESNYRYAKTYYDKLINTFYQKTKNLVLALPDDVDKLLDDDNLLKLALD
jgi:16S rRNA G966 N2-methylase RsmD